MIIDVNMDMVGRDPGNKLFAVGVYHNPFLKPYLENVAQPPVVLAFGHDRPGESDDWTRDSDHYVFHEAGIPWIYFGVEDVAQHHQATDDAATIGREFLAGSAATVIAAVHEFDIHLDEIAARRRQKQQ
jgi:Zn-dependent M28 family amino/carboxypeptidase